MKRLATIVPCSRTSTRAMGSRTRRGRSSRNPSAIARHTWLSAPATWISTTLVRLAVVLLIDLAGSENDRLYERWNARAIAMLERLKSLPDIHVADLCQLSRTTDSARII